uniref:Copine domain-containing protein n=2 Tax=Mesocestoides corti TaxID=53468 RepID=A0A5K3FSA9_MESCO
SEKVKWAVFFTPPSDTAGRKIHDVRVDISRAAYECGMKFDANPFAADQIMPAALKLKFDECKRNGVHLMIFVLSGNNEYPQIKRLGDLYTG